MLSEKQVTEDMQSVLFLDTYISMKKIYVCGATGCLVWASSLWGRE